MGEVKPELSGAPEVFPYEYVFEAAERLERVEWGRYIYPTDLHIPVHNKHLIHTDILDPDFGTVYHLSTHPGFFDLPKSTPDYLIPAYGARTGGITGPLVSLTNRETQTPTHLLLPNFEPNYYHYLGYGLKYAIWPFNIIEPETKEGQLIIPGIDEPGPEAQLEFRKLFERLCP